MKTINFYINHCFLCRMIPVVILVMVYSSGSTGFAQSAPAKRTALESQILNAQKVAEREKIKLQKNITKLEEARKFLAAYELKLDEMVAKESSLNASMEAYPEILRTLQTQRVQLMIDLAGIEAKREAIVKFNQNSEKKAQELKVLELTPLKEILAMQTAQADKLARLKTTGAAVQADLYAAKLSVLSTRAKIQQATSKHSQSNRINEMALDLALERAEKTARLDRTQGLLNEIFEERSILMSRKNLMEKRDRVLASLDGLKNNVEIQQKVFDAWNKLLKENPDSEAID